MLVVVGRVTARPRRKRTIRGDLVRSGVKRMKNGGMALIGVAAAYQSSKWRLLQSRRQNAQLEKSSVNDAQQGHKQVDVK